MININVVIDADEEHFDMEGFKQSLQEFIKLNIGNFDFSICTSQKDLLTEAIWAVNLFDQANTGRAIEMLGNRGKYVKGAIDDLRDIINKDKKMTILTREQASGD